METEKSTAQISAEKEAYDQSGHSEKQIDIHLNQAISHKQSVKSGLLFSSKKQENVILEKK